MSSPNPVDLLWERDEARGKVQRLERELAEARRLLSYAEEAIRAEYQLRVAQGMRCANCDE